MVSVTKHQYYSSPPGSSKEPTSWLVFFVTTAFVMVALTALSSSTSTSTMSKSGGLLTPLLPATAIPGASSLASRERHDDAAAVVRSNGGGVDDGSSNVRMSIAKVLVQPMVLEVGALLLVQAVGLPLLSKTHKLLVPLLRRVVLRMPALRRYNARLLPSLGRVWKTMVKAYHKTSASKIVTRSKKTIKIFMHHDHDGVAVEQH